MEKRVVVTGLGAITPIGNNIGDFWDNLTNGTSGAAQITKFDTFGFKTKFACEVKDFSPQTMLSREEIKRSDLFTQYALVAATEAIQDSHLEIDEMSPYDIGVIWGSGQGGMKTFEEEVMEYGKSQIPRFSPFFVPKMILNMAAGMISIKFGLKGISFTTVSACATSNTSIMDAYNYIKFGKAKVFITGGSEAAITEAGVGSFNSMKALSTNNENPAAASRPFDKFRDGFVMGEGAGALVLEELEHAQKRGAKIYAEIVGASMTSDAYHISAPHPDGTGAAKAMELALNEAKVNPEKVHYLNAHATSTPVGDISEIEAVSKVFGAAPPNLTVSSTKSMTGHLLGAAGAIESIVCIKSITDSIIPPTINTDEIDETIPRGMKIVTKESINTKVEVAVTNSFGFGGHNASLVFKKFE